MLFRLPFYHFLLTRYLNLTERHFLSDILVPLPDFSNLYSREYLVHKLGRSKNSLANNPSAALAS